MQESHNFRYLQLNPSAKTVYIPRSSYSQQQSQPHSLFRLHKPIPKLQHISTLIKPTDNRPSFSPINKNNQKSELHCLYRSQPKQNISVSRAHNYSLTRDHQVQSRKYKAVTKQGRRPYNEDRYICKPKLVSPFALNRKCQRQEFDLFAVFDGHGGSQCSQFLKENFHILLTRSPSLQTNPELALKEALAKIQEKFLSLCQNKEPLQTSGSCALACLLSKDKVYIANLGDCRAMFLSKGKFQVLTQDHKPGDQEERIRILRHGGKLYRDQEGTVNQIKVFRQLRIQPGNLNVSRTIGDIEVKLKRYGGLPGMISSVPDLSCFDTQGHSMLLLASDGLFEAFSEEEIHRRFAEQSQSDWQHFADTIAEEALERSSDNITAVTVLLE